MGWVTWMRSGRYGSSDKYGWGWDWQIWKGLGIWNVLFLKWRRGRFRIFGVLYPLPTMQDKFYGDLQKKKFFEETFWNGNHRKLALQNSSMVMI